MLLNRIKLKIHIWEIYNVKNLKLQHRRQLANLKRRNIQSKNWLSLKKGIRLILISCMRRLKQLELDNQILYFIFRILLILVFLKFYIIFIVSKQIIYISFSFIDKIIDFNWKLYIINIIHQEDP